MTFRLLGVRALLPVVALFVVSPPAIAATDVLLFESDPAARMNFSGPLGARIDANVRGWLLPCPAANPGMLEMFALRDRQPASKLVPWAGEFVGKYLLSAIGTLSMVDDAALEKQVASVIEQLYAAQADDGYLGPFPRDQRLLANWDLWGHYHIMQALLMWHERTGDQRALAACRKMADLMTRTYLDGTRRVIDAGSHEMNMAAIHGLGMLYRKTGEPRYRELMTQIEQDWQRSGDYFRTGVAGEEFARTPRPRWESLHDLQGLTELYRITGDKRYRDALLQHWNSIRRWDRRNSGAFSSGEQATGNPFEPTAIETCCTIAWMALSIDALTLSGDSRVADELELSTYNGMLGAQHPSGRWWTYSTPMDGVREASAHAIVFQARAGTPELNCCSVNGPRGLAMLAQWGVMRSERGLAINHYGPGEVDATTRGGRRIKLVQETRYPLDGHVRIRMIEISPPEKTKASPLALSLRIPAWSRETKLAVNGQPQENVCTGEYCVVERDWQAGDTIELTLDMRTRYVTGDLDAAGQVSLYRGPLLLAFDQADNELDTPDVPQVDVAALDRWQVVEHDADTSVSETQPWLRVAADVDGKRVVLRDFASAGASGTHYRSWLPAQNAAPPAPVAWQPLDGAKIPAGRALFTWRRPAASEREERKHRVLIADEPSFAEPLVSYGEAIGDRVLIPADTMAKLKPGVDYYWQVIATNAAGAAASEGPDKRFQIDESLPPLSDAVLAPFGERADGAIVDAPLAGGPEAAYGKLLESRQVASAAGVDDRENGAIEFDGQSSLLRYAVPRFPVEQYTLVVSCRFDESAFAAPRSGRVQQVASAWCAGADDPLRLCLENGKLFARLESPSGGASTSSVPVEPNRWYHLVMVKDGARLRLFVDGQQQGETTGPVAPVTHATDIGLGGNPHHTGDEFLPARMAGFRLYARALSAEEVAELSGD